jgi:hypothetical protein
MPHVSAKFFMDIVMNHFITQRRDIKPILSDNSSLGAHANIVHFDFVLKKIKTYIWSHPVNRPFGNPMPTQCLSCGSLRSRRTVKSRTNLKVVVLECQAPKCDNLMQYDCPDGMAVLVKGKNGEGDWFFHENKL